MDYDSVKRIIDTAIQNSDPNIDVSDGTVTSLIVAGDSAAIAGVYGYAEMIGRKAFPDLCNFVDLKRWANIKGVAFDERTPEFVLRENVLRAFRTPPSGGDDWSFRDAVGTGIIFDIYENDRARGLGSMDIVLGHTASSADLSGVMSRINDMRPLGCADVQGSIAQRRGVEIRIVCTGFVDTLAVSTAVESRYGGDGDIPGSDLFRSVIEAVAVQHGAADARMFWRNSDSDTGEWIEGTCKAEKFFVERRSVYQHLIVERCFVELR
jgi:hypothetical protein